MQYCINIYALYNLFFSGHITSTPMTISSKIQWLQVFYPAIDSVFGDIVEVARPSSGVISPGHYHGARVWVRDRARTPAINV